MTCEAASALAALPRRTFPGSEPEALAGIGPHVDGGFADLASAVPVTDDEAYALAARLPKATFNRWRPRELPVRISEIGARRRCEGARAACRRYGAATGAEAEAEPAPEPVKRLDLIRPKGT